MKKECGHLRLALQPRLVGRGCQHGLDGGDGAVRRRFGQARRGRPSATLVATGRRARRLASRRARRLALLVPLLLLDIMFVIVVVLNHIVYGLHICCCF